MGIVEWRWGIWLQKKGEKWKCLEIWHNDGKLSENEK